MRVRLHATSQRTPRAAILASADQTERDVALRLSRSAGSAVRRSCATGLRRRGVQPHPCWALRRDDPAPQPPETSQELLLSRPSADRVEAGEGEKRPIRATILRRQAQRPRSARIGAETAGARARRISHQPARPSGRGPDSPASAEVHREEVPVIRRQISRDRAGHAGEQGRGAAGAGLGVHVERHPVGVDVELHRS
jgi:hypothetical protein